MVFVSMNNFKVASIIEKLRTTWKDIQKKKLLDIKKEKKKKDYSLERLQRYLRIEEEG